MSRLGYFLGGAVVGAVCLGIASCLIDKYSKSTPAALPACDDETDLETHSESPVDTSGTPTVEAV